MPPNTPANVTVEPSCASVILRSPPALVWIPRVSYCTSAESFGVIAAPEDSFAPEAALDKWSFNDGRLCADPERDETETSWRGFCYMYGNYARQIPVAATGKPIRVSDRINQLPGWAQNYIMRVHTFVGAEEVEELVFLRDDRPRDS
jgi:hypothetical protein